MIDISKENVQGNGGNGRDRGNVVAPPSAPHPSHAPYGQQFNAPYGQGAAAQLQLVPLQLVPLEQMSVAQIPGAPVQVGEKAEAVQENEEFLQMQLEELRQSMEPSAFAALSDGLRFCHSFEEKADCIEQAIEGTRQKQKQQIQQKQQKQHESQSRSIMVHLVKVQA